MSGELELTPIEQINAEHHACEAAVRSALKHAVRCGALLEEQKATVNHGGWQRWLEENFDGSVRTAQVYMRLSRNREAVEEAAQAQSSAHLSIDGALRALAAPKEPDQPEDSEPLEYHKRKANFHTERADAAFAEAEREYQEGENYYRKFVALYDTHRATLGPETGAKVDKLRAEVEAVVQHAQEEREAMRSLLGR